MAGRDQGRKPGQVLLAPSAVHDRPPLRRLGTRISLIIPAFNEAATIRQAVVEAEAALQRDFADFEVLVVDDGSKDETAAVVEGLRVAAPHTRLLRHERNRGYGSALRTGFEAARFDLVAFTDADCQFDLADLGKLADRVELCPIVAGYRVNRKDSARRRFFSWGYNRLVRNLLGTRVRDCDCALKVFRRTALEKLLPESSGFFVNAEMLARARQLDLPVAELPVAHRPRLGGESKVSLREVPRMLGTLLSYWWGQTVRDDRLPTATPGDIPMATPVRGVALVPPPPSERVRPAESLARRREVA